MEERGIGGLKYVMPPLRLVAWRKLFAVVSRFAGVIIGAVSAGGKNAGIQALAAMTAGIDEESLVVVEKLLGSSSYVLTGDAKIELVKDDARERHFSGKYADYMKWLAFGLEVNFRPLLDELAKASTKPPAETGSSQ